MPKQKAKPFDFLGTYILPTPRAGRSGMNLHALVVLHLELSGTDSESVTTALILIGKKDAIEMEKGTHHEFLGLAGVSQPFLQN